MNREQKLLHNQYVRRIGLLVNLILRNVVALPQAVIDLILKDLRSTLYVQPLRALTLTLPQNLPASPLNPFRSFNRGEDPTTRISPYGPGVWFGRLGYGSFQ